MRRIERVNQLLGGGEAPFGVEDLVVGGEVTMLDAAAWVIDEALLGLMTDIARAAGDEEQPGWRMDLSERVMDAVEGFVDANADLVREALGDRR